LVSLDYIGLNDTVCLKLLEQGLEIAFGKNRIGKTKGSLRKGLESHPIDLIQSRTRGLCRDRRALSASLDINPTNSDGCRPGKLFETKEQLIAEACNVPNALIVPFRIVLFRPAA
jgi:hypothetical protein